MLEALQHSENAFVTLTYEDEKLPFVKNTVSGLPMPTLVPRDLQLFMKSLRKRMDKEFGRKFRFYGVGEYGGKSERPHYHLALFNFPSCLRGRTLTVGRSELRDWRGCCPVCRMVGEIWDRGIVEVRTLDEGKCGYVAGYVTKKMTSKEDVRLQGRHPEFPRQSNGGGKAKSGGIGVGGLDAIYRQIVEVTDKGSLLDVPTHLNYNRKPLLLGRYLRKKLRERLGFKDGKISEAYDIALQLQALQEHRDTEKAVGRRLTKKEEHAIRNAPYDEKLKFRETLNHEGKI